MKDPAQDPEVVAWIADFADQVRQPDPLDAWVERTLAEIAVGVEEAGATGMPELIAAAVRAQWLAFLDHIAGGAPVVLPEAAKAAALELARRRYGVPVLLEIYRRAQDASWSYAVDLVEEAPADFDRAALLVTFWGAAREWFDASVNGSIVIHQEETRRIERRGDAQRLEAVQAVLAGESREPRELSAALGGYAVTGTHVAFVVRALGPDAIAGAEQVALRLAAAVGVGRPLLVHPTGVEVWGWVSARSAPAEPPALDLAAHRAAYGGPAAGLDGFVAAHREAQAALPVALAPGCPAGPVAYDDVALLALLARDRAAADQVVRRTLGALAGAGHAHLRATVLGALTDGPDATAQELAIHRNTVRYRIGQAERLLGRRLRERPAELAVALRYAAVFGLEVD